MKFLLMSTQEHYPLSTTNDDNNKKMTKNLANTNMNTYMSNPAPECTISSDAGTLPCIYSRTGESEDDLSHDDTYDCPSVNEFDFDNSSSDIASITTKHANNDLEQNTSTTCNCMFIEIQASDSNHYVYINDTDQVATLKTN